MNDTQIVSIAIIFVAAIASVLFNNSRISDLRTDVGKRFDDVSRHIDDKFALLDLKIESKFQLIDQKLDHIIDLLANHEGRASRSNPSRG